MPWTRDEALFAALLALLSVLYAMPLFAGGAWFVSHEMMHALTRLAEFDRALRGGQFPVRWSDSLMAGHGYPLFNFFAPFSFLVADVFLLLGASLPAAWKCAVVVFRFAGALGMHGLLRHRCGRAGAAFGALLFMAAQYHACTLYVRGNLQEFAALNLWTFAFWGVEAVARRRSWRAIAVPAAAIAVGVLATSHVLTTYMAAFHLLAFGAFQLAAQGRAGVVRALPFAVATALLGCACAAWFIVPAVAEIAFTRNAVLTEWTRVDDHFLAWRQLFKPSWGYGLSVPGTDDGMPLDLGLGVWAAVAAGIAAMVRRRGAARSFAGFALAMFAATCFAMTPLASPLWRIWPKAQWLQFPWRLLVPATFWGCAFAACAMAPAIARLAESPRSRLALAAALLLPCAFVAPLLRPLFFWEKIPTFAEEELRLVMTNTMTGEYLPLAVETWPERPSMRAIAVPESRRAFPTDRTGSASYIAIVDVAAGDDAVFDVFHFPGWRVEIDGVPVATRAVPPSGLIGWTFEEGGEHEVVVRFGESPLRMAANGASLAAWIGCLAWIAFAARRERAQALAPANRAGENGVQAASASPS